MAKKPSTPKPPSVQAPKRRDTTGAGRGSGSSIPPWVWLVGVVILLAIAAGAFAITRGSSSEESTTNVREAMLAAGCTYREVKPYPPKDGGNYHNDAPTLASKVKWATFPPSGGGHYAQWAVWGFYRDEPANPVQVVHNLEHGGVAMWWGPRVAASTIDQLESFYNESPDAMFGTPIAGLGNKIALTAWTGDPAHYYKDGDYGLGHIAICSKFDESAFKTFRDAFRTGGPEGIPASSNKPGTGPG